MDHPRSAVEAYLDAGCLGIEELLRVQREGFQMLDLYWQGLPPSRPDRFIEQLAPKWEELLDLIAQSRERGKAMLEKKRRWAMPVSEEVRRQRAYADQQWLAKEQREYQRWEEARRFPPDAPR